MTIYIFDWIFRLKIFFLENLNVSILNNELTAKYLLAFEVLERDSVRYYKKYSPSLHTSAI